MNGLPNRGQTARWVAIWLLISLPLLGCAGKDPNRKLTVPVRGQVFVDGEPAAMLQVECHPVDGIDTQQPTITHAVNDSEGKFELSTYEAGDGAPLGQYKLTFRWQDFNVVSASYSGPDKLKKRYADMGQSEFSLTVEDGKPIELGRIDLTTEL